MTGRDVDLSEVRDLSCSVDPPDDFGDRSAKCMWLQFEAGQWQAKQAWLHDTFDGFKLRGYPESKDEELWPDETDIAAALEAIGRTAPDGLGERSRGPACADPVR